MSLTAAPLPVQPFPGHPPEKVYPRGPCILGDGSSRLQRFDLDRGILSPNMSLSARISPQHDKLAIRYSGYRTATITTKSQRLTTNGSIITTSHNRTLSLCDHATTFHLTTNSEGPRLRTTGLALFTLRSRQSLHRLTTSSHDEPPFSKAILLQPAQTPHDQTRSLCDHATALRLHHRCRISMPQRARSSQSLR
jgi:hypothetical protein